MRVSREKGNGVNRGRKRIEERTLKSRKEIRKEKRKEKRMRKCKYFARKRNEGKFSKHEPEKSIDISEYTVKRPINCGPLQSRNTDGFIKHQLREKEKEVLRRQKLEKEMKKTRQIQLKEANREEDKVIKKLEKQLKLNKRKSKSVPKSFASDGLDYLLEVCDEDKMKQAVLLEQTLHESDSEFEEDFALAKGKKIKSQLPDKSDRNQDSDIETEIDSNGDNESNDIDDDCDNSINQQVIKAKINTLERNESDSEISVNDLFEVESQTSQNIFNFKVAKTIRTSDSVKRKHKRSDSCIEDVSQQNSSRMVKDTKFNCKNHGDGLQTTSEKKANQSKNMDNLSGEGGLYVKLRSIDHKNGVKKAKTKHMHVLKSGLVALNDSSDDSLEEDVDSEEDQEEEEFEDHDGGGTSKSKEFWEDIYGRTRDNKGNIIQVSAGKYVPPQLRAQVSFGDAKKKEQLLRLQKQIKGLLNRLAENNMNSIAMQLDELYMTNSRNDMNETLTTLIFDALVVPVLTPERLIMEHCMLIAILHANVGTEVGAHFLQAVVKKFSELHTEDCEIENKQLDNVILTICHLYNFKVFNSLLMYNILDKLSEIFGSKEVELILLVLRSVGFSLRKDDPGALKALVLQLQQKASKASQSQSDSRVQFMLDILLAIKNNNMAKIPNYNPSHSEHLKKLLKGFLRKGNYVTELKISLEDLLKAEERGRWWVVGSAWSGVLPSESQNELKGDQQQKTLSKSQNYSQKLLDLARKQRMNTDVRRNIFCILMTSEDFLDAFEKLLHLGLKNQQECEIIHVILDCCLHEKEFNPYYAHLTLKFCEFDRKYQMILQYNLWDKFKEVQNLSAVQIRNLAQFLVMLFVEKGLPLSLLKVIHFAEVDKAMVRLLRQVLLGIMLHKSQESMQEVFQRVAVAPKLHMFRESIRLFIQHFLLRKTDSLPEEDLKTLKDRANVVDTILSMVESRSRLF